MASSERLSECCLSSSTDGDRVPACVATDGGRKNAIGVECGNCPDAVRMAVATALADSDLFSEWLH